MIVVRISDTRAVGAVFNASGYGDSFLTITPKDWVESAKDSGLDPDRVLGIVQEVADGVREHLDATLGAIDHPRVTAEILSDIRESADQQTGIIPLRSAMSKSVS